MELVLDPPHGVGPLRLGMTSDEARTALAALGPLEPSRTGAPAVHLPSGLGITVGFGVGPTRDRVNAIELWRPEDMDVVRYRESDVFGMPALAVVERLHRHPDLVLDEDDAGIRVRELYLALWRPFAADEDPSDVQGYFFQSALVARPGYDDSPAEAAARLAAGGVAGY